MKISFYLQANRNHHTFNNDAAFYPKSEKQHELREDQKKLFFKRGELLYEVVGEGNTPLHTLHGMLITCFLPTKNMLVSDTSQY